MPTLQEISPEPQPQPAKKSSFRLLKVLKISGGLALLMASALVCLPYLLATDYAREKLVEGLSQELGTEVQIASYKIGWFSGLSLEGLVIANPPSYSRATKQNAVLRLDRIDFDLSLANLLRGRIDIEASISGLDLHVLYQPDGRSNIEDLFGRIPSGPGHRDFDDRHEQWQHQDSGESWLDRIRLDLELRDSTIEFAHMEHGLLEKVEAINVRLSKSFGFSSMRVECSADFHRPDKPNRPGRIRLLGRVSPESAEPIDLELHCQGLELERYRALLTVLLPPGQITQFAGQVRADCELHCDPEGHLAIEGLIEIERPRFGGELFAGMSIAAERWSLRPNIQALLGDDWTPVNADISRFELDLGFLQAQGQSSSGPGMEFSFQADLEALTKLGIPALAKLQDSTGKVEGRLQFENGQLAIEMDADDINGGSMHIDANLGPLTEEETPIRLTLNLQAVEAKADDIKLLSYLVPFMAGSKSAGIVNFRTLVDFEVEVEGRYNSAAHTTAIALLAALKGRGKLALRGGRFVPADELSRLFSILGRREALELRDLVSEFTLDHGQIETSLLELSSQGRRFSMRGTTSLDGEIDYLIDASDLLRGHRNGERMLSYLGAKGLQARLTGNLDAPSLAMPDLAELLRKAAGGALNQEFEEQAKKGLDRLLRKILKKKK